jgi:Activator of Hsp90 ATPase homolog 1-like protein
MVAHVYRIEDGLIRSMEIRSADRKEPMMSNTVQFHRVLRAAPEKVYRAFLDGDAMAKWVPPYGFTPKVHHMDAKVGGTYKMSFTNFTTGRSHSFGGEYLELVPHERIRYPTTGNQVTKAPLPRNEIAHLNSASPIGSR